VARILYSFKPDNLRRVLIDSNMRQSIYQLAVLTLISASFPIFSYLSGINPRMDSLSKFDTFVLFARTFNVEKEFPAWSTLNFGNFTALENLGLRPEDVLGILIGNSFEFDSILLFIYLVIFLGNLIMNMCFVSICKELGINKIGLVFALVFILNFVAFPFTQYLLHYQVILFSVVLIRIYISIGKYPIKHYIFLIIPVCFVVWGGYSLILPAIALSPTVLLGIRRRKFFHESISLRPNYKVWTIFILVSFLSLVVFFVNAFFFFTEARTVKSGRSSSGIARLENYLSPAGRGVEKFLEVLGAPTVWQDTHFVVSPIFFPFLLGFLLFVARYLSREVKWDLSILFVTFAWSVLLTLPSAVISSLLWKVLPFIGVTRYPGFQMGVLLPLSLLVLGIMIMWSADSYSSKEDFFPKMKGGGIQKSKTQHNTSFKDRRRISGVLRMYIFGWFFVIAAYVSNALPYPFVWAKVMLEHVLEPLVLLLCLLMLVLLFFKKELLEHIFRGHFVLFRLPKSRDFQTLFLSFSTIMILSLGIFQMYFLSFKDYRSIESMRSPLITNWEDNNFLARLAIRRELEGRVTDWESTSRERQEEIISMVRAERLNYDLDPAWMRLIDLSSDQKLQIHTRPFHAFLSKTFINDVLFEKTPVVLSNPLSSSRAPLRISGEGTSYPNNAYGINEDFCPALGPVDSINRNLSPLVIQALASSKNNTSGFCSEEKILLYDETGNSARSWITNSSISIRNKEVKFFFRINENLIGKTLEVVYKDAYSELWSAKINGDATAIGLTPQGFKSLKFTLEHQENVVTFELPFWFRTLINSRLLIDPLLYLAMLFFAVFSLNQRPVVLTGIFPSK